MKIQTKRNLLRAASAAAFACTAALIFLPAVASAAEAVAGGSANVRSGPSTSYGIVDRLYAGESVDVEGCRNGWCYITHSGPDGFVSASLLRAGGTAMQPNFNLSFNFPQGGVSIGTGGVSIGIGTPGPGPGPGTSPGGSNDDEACFYSGSGYNGSRFCLSAGQQMAYVGANWNNRISSIRNRSGLKVTVCDDSGYDICRTYSTSASNLGDFDNQISSIRVR